RPHLRSDTETFRREIHADFGAHFAETSAQQRRGQIVLSGDRTLQAILASGRNHVTERLLRDFPQTRQRHRLYRRRIGNRRRPFPVYMIENVASSAETVAA